MLSNQREYTIFVVGLLIGFVAGYLVFGLAGGQDTNTTPQQNNDAEEQNATSTENGDTTDEEDQQNQADTISLSVEDQTPGMSVAVSEITTSEPVWVAIREKNDDDTPGRILGAKLFSKDTNSGDVTLLRRTVPEAAYYATIYTDDGDHEFEFDSDDEMMTNSDGETVLVEFKTFPTTPN